MTSLYLLIPFSVLLVLALIAVFAWALDAGQFEDLEREGVRILADDDPAFDGDQGVPLPSKKESPRDL